MPSTPHDDNLRFMNIILTVAVPQTIPSLEESHKELRILPPSQLQNQLDKKAAATVCMRHHALQGELATLQLRYREFSDITRDLAFRIQKTQEQLAYITNNIDQVYGETLHALFSANAPATTDKPSIYIEDDICNILDKNLSL